MKEAALSRLAEQVQAERLHTSWRIGKALCKGGQDLQTLAVALSKDLGRDFSPSDLQEMRLFYLSCPDGPGREAAPAQGCPKADAGGLFKDPAVQEFLGKQKDKPDLEGSLQKVLARHLKHFLLACSTGFLFAGTKPGKTDCNGCCDADMVFYHKPLRSYVLVKLKTAEILPEDAGKMSRCLAGCEARLNDPDDNKPAGIILCAGKTGSDAKYVLGSLPDDLFASRYRKFLPDGEELARLAAAVFEQWRRDKVRQHC